MTRTPSRGLAATRLALAAALVAGAIATATAASPASPVGPPIQDDQAPEQTFGERIEVSRVLVDLRVIDGRGEAVGGLGPGDLEVLLDGRPAEIEAVEWHGTATLDGDPPPEPAHGTSAPSPAEPASGGVPGRARAPSPAAELVVIFIQSADFIFQFKAIGHQRLLPGLEEMIEGLAPGQRAAVVRHGGSLRIESDFTGDPARIKAAVRRALFGGAPPAADDRRGPSLAAGLDPERARRAGAPEEALAATADALAPLPGSKAIVFVGWGLTGNSRDWQRLRESLAAARAPVFVLDVTSADSHFLELELRHLANVTGGTYASTYYFPEAAVHRLESVLESRYTLVLRAPRLPPGLHPLRVRLTWAAGRGRRTVLAPDTVVVAADGG